MSQQTIPLLFFMMIVPLKIILVSHKKFMSTKITKNQELFHTTVDFFIALSGCTSFLETHCFLDNRALARMTANS